ncbi:HDIG domain-containing metalloprotein [Pendulispora albinea]|uniref:HDIG domain-containing protein n=1 Tax=Pendulispora albinea TaxID=2741071 RepID=A0ABZ2M1F8_9BACT
MLRTRVRAGAIAGVVMSLGFAVIITFAQVGDALIPQLAPRFGAPTPTTIRVPYASFIQKNAPAVEDAASLIAYEHARVIIPRGTVLDGTNDLHRIGYAFEMTRRPARTIRTAAMFIIHLTLLLLVSAYLRRFGPTRTRLLRTQLGLFGTMAAAFIVAKTILVFTPLSEFWIPVATVPLWCTFAFERRTAFLINMMMGFMASALLLFDLPFLAVLVTRGLAASLLFLNRKHPRQMMLSGLGGGLIAATMYAAIMTVFEGRFSPERELYIGLESPVLGIVGGGLLAGILAHLLRQTAVRAVGSVGRDRLMDLTDLEHPLLRKMAEEAPGSWEHARAMANLAEAAAAAIGADALLTRVGAYYHDLGKTIQPKYFVENLGPGERSPHEDLEPEVSADAIMAHVVQGTKLLRDRGIPEPVVEFAYTHHGTQVIEYFWHKCKSRGNAKNLTEDFFRYPGMRPQTKETAILMLVDSIEAASRTIQPPEKAKFEEMIQRILFTKLKTGQLDESGLTVEDLKILIVKMADTLVAMYHGRIKYPWQEKDERSGGRRASKGALVAAAPLSKPPTSGGSGSGESGKGSSKPN